MYIYIYITTHTRTHYVLQICARVSMSAVSRWNLAFSSDSDSNQIICCTALFGVITLIIRYLTDPAINDTFKFQLKKYPLTAPSASGVLHVVPTTSNQVNTRPNKYESSWALQNYTYKTLRHFVQ